MIQDYIVKIFNTGLITRIKEDEKLPPGSASDALNWFSNGTHIELRRGQQLLGSENSGAGKITGLFVGKKFDGTEVVVKSYGRKLKYYNSAAEDWVEIGSDTLPADANGEDVAMDAYESLAGSFIYISSPNSSIYKLPCANPGSIVDQSSTSHRGKIKIKQNRMFLWDRKDSNGGSDKTGLFGGYVDKDELSDFTEVTAESVGTGDGSTKNFTDTLAQRTGKRTVMYVRITDSTEVFTDDRNGNLSGDKGGTGTINYATGVFDITFNDAPANLQAITADYYYEDATSTGICDFSKSTPRSAGEGFVFRQDDGGADMQNMGSIGGDEFCMHKHKTWKLTLSSDDTNATNLIYRSKVGIEYWRAMMETGDGVYYMDSRNQNDPHVRILKQSEFVEKVLPKSISDQLDLSDYIFDKAVVFEFDPYIIVACRTSDSSVNNRTLFYDKTYKLWNITNYRISCIERHDGALIAGDDGSDNVLTLLSSLSDGDSIIPNHWITEETDLNRSGVKRSHRMVMAGLIGKDQKLKISVSLDEGEFVEVGNDQCHFIGGGI